MPYFSVADTDEALERAQVFGAQVVIPAQDTPYGRMATLLGPQGERFSVISG
jgi:predicted enzyme related to lactoylglutathione lyase